MQSFLSLRDMHWYSLHCEDTSERPTATTTGGKHTFRSKPAELSVLLRPEFILQGSLCSPGREAARRKGFQPESVA